MEQLKKLLARLSLAQKISILAAAMLVAGGLIGSQFGVLRLAVQRIEPNDRLIVERVRKADAAAAGKTV